MKNQKGISLIVVILIIIGILVIGGGVYWWLTGGKFTKAGICYKNLSNLGRSGIPSMPDPASYFCKCMGGNLNIEKNPTTGGEKGLCKIGSETYGEWEYFCSKNKDDNVYVDCKNKKATDKKSCEALGGKWGSIGLSPEEKCNLPTSDAGKECSDSSECEGSCMAELSKEDLNKLSGKIMGEEVIYTKGRCTAWRITVGCHAFVRDGKVEGILCAD